MQKRIFILQILTTVTSIAIWYLLLLLEIKAEEFTTSNNNKNTKFINHSPKPRNHILSAHDIFSKNYAISSHGYSSLKSISDLKAGTAQIVVQPDMVDVYYTLLLSMATWRNIGEESTIVRVTGYDNREFSSNQLSKNGFIELGIPYTPKSLHTPHVNYRNINDESENWKFYSDDARIDYDKSMNTYYAVISTNKGGYFIATNDLDSGMMTVVTLLVLVFGILSGYLIAQKCKYQKQIMIEKAT